MRTIVDKKITTERDKAATERDEEDLAKLMAAERAKCSRYVEYKTVKAATAVGDTVKKIAAKDADQYMLRLPPGLRDRVARRAADNGRSMNTEIVEAIEHHLTRADRVTQLWELFTKHQENIEAIPVISSAIEDIEGYLEDVRSCFPEDARPGRPPEVLYKWMQKKQHDVYVAHVATLPVLTADQAQTIKALLKETGAHEERFLTAIGAPRIEDIRDFEGAMKLLGERLLSYGAHSLPADQVHTIKALLKEIGSGGETFLAAIGADARSRLGLG
jgi:predicted HicB family RNase H-like nuclease